MTTHVHPFGRYIVCLIIVSWTEGKRSIQRGDYLAMQLLYVLAYVMTEGHFRTDRKKAFRTQARNQRPRYGR